MSDNHATTHGERPAILAPADLYARYDTGGGHDVTLRIYAFSTEGDPLVLAHDDNGTERLVRPEVAQRSIPYVGARPPAPPPLTGPFTPAPAGLMAVFKDGHEQPVLYYDVHGRAVLMDENDVMCDLFLAESTNDVVRVEYRPSAAADDRDDEA